MIIKYHIYIYINGSPPPGDLPFSILYVIWIVLACRLARGTDQVLRHSCLRVKAQTGVEAYEQAAQS